MVPLSFPAIHHLPWTPIPRCSWTFQTQQLPPSQVPTRSPDGRPGPFPKLEALSLMHSSIARFLHSYPDPLTAAQFAPLCITAADFKLALNEIEPSAQREGFATLPDVTWSDIGALHGTRSELHMAVVQPIRRPELFRAVGIDAPAGVLLWGPPGCGKTLLAKAVANESQASFISMKGPELLNKVCISHFSRGHKIEP